MSVFLEGRAMASNPKCYSVYGAKSGRQVRGSTRRPCAGTTGALWFEANGTSCRRQESGPVVPNLRYGGYGGCGSIPWCLAGTYMFVLPMFGFSVSFSRSSPAELEPVYVGGRRRTSASP